VRISFFRYFAHDVRNNEQGRQEEGKYRAVRRNANVTNYGNYGKTKGGSALRQALHETFIFIK